MDEFRDSPPDPGNWGPADGRDELYRPPPTDSNEQPWGDPRFEESEPDESAHAESEPETTGSDQSPQPSGADAVASALREQLDGVVADSRAISAAEASRMRGIYGMLQDALAHPGVFIPMRDGATQADLDAEAEGWVRSSLAQEIGAAIGVTKGHAQGLLNDAELLCEKLSSTFGALEAGEITRQHVDAMLRQAVSLDAGEAAAFEAEALPKAMVQSATQFARAAVKIREGLFPETITERRTEAVKQRRVECYGTQDGMAVLSLYGPVEVVQSLVNAATRTARALKTAGDDRTLAQIEADAVTDALMKGFTTDGPKPGVGASGVGADRLGGIRPTVHVTVPVMTLLGHSNEPGQLDGYGPIAPDIARELAARAPSFTRLLTHPETGAVLSVGRDSYAVPADLKRTVRLRDETCTGIGCDRPATICDLDHIEQWQHGGETKLSNLQPGCEQHHMLRHHTMWQVHTDGDRIEWVSPLGITYQVPRTSNVQFLKTGAEDKATVSGEAAADDDQREALPEEPLF
ncbi:HNH endonuclease signature motif containing protein [Paramicrobacterium agarici]|nr:HNH endonuclease signature motif containing protein [Microbacterium agarici]